MEKKKKIIVIAIGLGVLAVSSSRSFVDLRSVATLWEGGLAFISKHLVALVPTLVGGISMCVFFAKRLSAAFSDVEVSYVDGKVTCDYPNLDFINMRAVRVYLKMHFLLWRSLKKRETTQKQYEDIEVRVNQELEEIVSERIINNDLFVWDGEDRTPENYVNYRRTVLFVNDMLSIDERLEPYLAVEKRDDTYVLWGSNFIYRLAESTFKNKIVRLQERIESTSRDAGVRKRVKSKVDAKSAAVEAQAAFNKRLAVLVRTTNFWAMKKASRKNRGIFRHD